MTILSVKELAERVEQLSQTESGRRPKTKAVLNQAVADLVVARTIIHQIHWYMRGRGFLHLHPFMDTLIDAISEHLDELSERLITLGGFPYSTLGEFLDVTTLVEVKGDYDRSVQDHIERLIAVYSQLANLFQVGLDVTDEEGDDPSNGLFADAQGEVEKNIWQLQAELGQAPGLY
ncbi:MULTISPECIES: DNA starvation/stationary phase protection protein [unclassified Streptococcus]|uniref:Dps family protein n=1 Tax=unclassified Streptococcus TaxID=2608887 RepID=UPI00359E56DE